MLVQLHPKLVRLLAPIPGRVNCHRRREGLRDLPLLAEDSILNMRVSCGARHGRNVGYNAGAGFQLNLDFTSGVKKWDPPACDEKVCTVLKAIELKTRL